MALSKMVLSRAFRWRLDAGGEGRSGELAAKTTSRGEAAAASPPLASAGSPELRAPGSAWKRLALFGLPAEPGRCVMGAVLARPGWRCRLTLPGWFVNGDERGAKMEGPLTSAARAAAVMPALPPAPPALPDAEAAAPLPLAPALPPGASPCRECRTAAPAAKAAWLALTKGAAEVEAEVEAEVQAEEEAEEEAGPCCASNGSASPPSVRLRTWAVRFLSWAECLLRAACSSASTPGSG